MSHLATPYVIPQRVPSPGEADHSSLRIPDGPWNEDFWVLIPHAGDVRAATRQPCFVPGCERPSFYIIKSRKMAKETICCAHYMQWYRDGQPEPVEEWATTRAREPQVRSSRGVPNPCLDCSFFEPAGEGVQEAHRAHRLRLKTLINEAREAGDQAVVELNQPMLDRLDQILGGEDDNA